MDKKIWPAITLILMVLALILYEQGARFFANAGILIILIILPYSLRSLLKEESRFVVALNKITLLMPMFFLLYVSALSFRGKGSYLFMAGVLVLISALMFMVGFFDVKKPARNNSKVIKVGVWFLWGVWALIFALHLLILFGFHGI
jgi:hypothetical protein